MKIQSNKKTEILLADIGNTRTKIALWDGRKIKNIRYFLTKNIDMNFLKENKIIAASCVVNDKKKLLKKNNTFLISASKNTGINFDNINKKNIGADRVAAAAGAANFAKGNLVVIDSGTAITINAISSDRKFIGGLILPGFDLLSMSLHNATSALPYVKIDNLYINDFPGTNTKSAIKSGISYLLRGGLIYITREITKKCDFRNYTVIITGGNGRKLLEIIPNSIYLRDLVLYGVAQIWENHNEGKNLRNKD